jgi:pyrimidine-nucleoside phosphorylase
MNPVELIRKKRNGTPLTRAEIEWFLAGYVRGDIPDYQMSALLMAVYFTGMNDVETTSLTQVMLHSGEVVDLSAVPGIKVDKHSTGGVGDKVSLILAPMVAACGVPVPMISGRGLGHTGGTLDKLESIPGFRTDLTVDEYRRVIMETGLVLIGQTREIAPADRKMYALRDVTGTIESIPLIAGSIMSKKLAEGIDALVLDVKTGDGAFMETEEQAVALARALVGIGTTAGKQTVAFITEMDQPLGLTVGNWCEVMESVECLRGKNVPDLMEVTFVLGGAMVMLGGKASSIAEGMQLCRTAIWTGSAYEKFLAIVKRQGGDISFLERPDRYPPARHVVELRSPANGYVDRFATRRIGVLATELGAGRQKADDVIDPRAGIVFKKKIGDRVERGETLAILYTEREAVVERAQRELESCIHVGPATVQRKSCIRAVVDREGVKPWATPVLY